MDIHGIDVPAAGREPAATGQDDPAALQARQAWAQVHAALARITPTGLMHFVLLTAALWLIGWVLWSSWTAFVPFQIGVALAYITLPVVQAMSRVMPRRFAVLLTVVIELGLILLLIVGLVPIIVREIGDAVGALPPADELRSTFNDLSKRIDNLPPAVAVFVRDWMSQASTNVRSNLTDLVRQGLGIAAGVVLGALGTLSFVLSLLVLPTWLFAVLHDQPRIVRQANQVLPSGVRADVLAVVRIVDRVLSVYLRGLVVCAFLYAVATYGGLSLLEYLGFAGIQYKLFFALFVGLATLIPTFGLIFGPVPVIVISSLASADTGVAVLALFVVLGLLYNWLLAPRFAGRVVDLHPALLAMVLVAGTQFGLLGTLLAAPVAVILRDLFRYAYGRTSNPPRPAGVLPNESIRAMSRRNAVSARAVRVPAPAPAAGPLASTTRNQTR